MDLRHIQAVPKVYPGCTEGGFPYLGTFGGSSHLGTPTIRMDSLDQIASRRVPDSFGSFWTCWNHWILEILGLILTSLVLASVCGRQIGHPTYLGTFRILCVLGWAPEGKRAMVVRVFEKAFIWT